MQPLELSIPTLGDEPDLTTLAEQARAGSAAAFEALARRVRGRVRAWAERLTHDRDDAEDVTQLVLLRLHERIAEFEGRSRFTTWLYAITLRTALSRRAKERRHAALAEARTAPLATVGNADAEANSDALRHAARIAALLGSFGELLSGREREVFELGDLRGLTSAEIGHRLGLNPVTVRVHLVKARRRIRLRMLAEHPGLLEDYSE